MGRYGLETWFGEQWAFSAPVPHKAELHSSLLHAQLLPIPPVVSKERGVQCFAQEVCEPKLVHAIVVRQYQKIQEKCLVAQDGQDFRTDENERRWWSRHPLEKHASTVYTKNMFYKFSKEFEKTIEYDVKPVGQFQYSVEPNNNFVYGYGKKELPCYNNRRGGKLLLWVQQVW